MDNTSCVSRLVVKALTMHAIDLSEFAVVVVGKPAPYVNSLLRQPTHPYPTLTRETQADYWTMARWLQKTLPGTVATPTYYSSTWI